MLHSRPFFQTTLGFSNVQVQLQLNAQATKSWLEFLQTSFTKLPIKDRELITTLWEGTWNQRNQVWRGKPMEPSASLPPDHNEDKLLLPSFDMGSPNTIWESPTREVDGATTRSLETEHG